MKDYTTAFNAKRAALAAIKAGTAPASAFDIAKAESGAFIIEWAKPEPQPKAEPRPAAKKRKPAAPATPALGKRAAIVEAARTGEMPTPPDFSANTHKPYRAKLAQVVELVKARDTTALRALEIPTYSTSPRAIARYRDLAVMALEAHEEYGQ